MSLRFVAIGTIIVTYYLDGNSGRRSVSLDELIAHPRTTPQKVTFRGSLIRLG